jgi:hypothetical protein
MYTPSILRRYKQLCAYTHGAAGNTSGDFWESNGPIYVRTAFPVVEAELRETLAPSYLLLKIGWPGYTPTDGVRNLLSGPTTGSPRARCDATDTFPAAAIITRAKVWLSWASLAVLISRPEPTLIKTA